MSHVGNCGQWVSGPLQVTKQIGDEDGLLGSFTLCLYWEPDKDGSVYWVDFELFEVTELAESGSMEYERRGATHSPDPVASLSEAQAAAYGSVKFDGCTQFEVNSVHVDNRERLIALLNAIETAREECALAMPGRMVHEEYA